MRDGAFRVRRQIYYCSSFVESGSNQREGTKEHAICKITLVLWLKYQKCVISKRNAASFAIA